MAVSSQQLAVMDGSDSGDDQLFGV